MTQPLQRFGRADGLLLGLALLGFGLFAFVLPYQHPDAAADFTLGDERAAAAARQFLVEGGHTPEGMARQVERRRLPELAASLQRTLGRPAAVAALRDEGGSALPVYYWQVRWYADGDGEDRDHITVGVGDDEDEAALVFTVSLTREGAVWAFAERPHQRPSPPVDRQALRRVLSGEAASEVLAYPDSALVAAFTFSEADALWRAPPPAAEAARDSLAARIVQGMPAAVELGPAWAVALARYHLSRTAFASDAFRADSTWLARLEGQRFGPYVAVVRFVSEDRARPVRVDVRVAEAGLLLGLDAAFEAGRTAGAAPGAAAAGEADGSQEEAPEGEAPAPSGELPETVSALTFVLLVLFFLFLFFRRLHARLVDTRASLRDAFWGGLFTAVMMVMVLGHTFEELGLWIGLAITGGGSLFVGLLGGLLIFLISSTADSLTRESWPEKLESLVLVRNVTLRNVPVGLALLRGVALAGLLLGLFVSGLLGLPKAVLAFGDSPERFGRTDWLSPGVYYLSQYGFSSLLISLLVLMGVGTLLYRWRPRASLVVPGLVLTFVLLRAAPVEFASAGLAWASAGVVGTVLALAFWRYDVLTCFVAYFLLGVLWETAPGWLAAGSPAVLDVMIGPLLTVFLLGIAFVGLRSGRTGEALPRYVPAYIREFRQQERLTRELEIAHQVQLSLLPRTMPEVEGLDFAAVCLPAQEVGGDYYDFIEIAPGRLAVVVGDVSGKGIQAAFYMTLTKGFLQPLSRSVASPAEVLRRLNALFYANAPRGTFVSLVYGVLDLEARTFTFARAGHNPIILKRLPSASSDLVLPGGMAIGLAPGEHFDHTVEEVTLRLGPGDVLVFYTDGFSEAMNAAKEQYGESRLARTVGRVGDRSAAAVLQAVSEDVHRFVESGGRHDDMTMMVVRFGAAADSPARRSEQAENAVSDSWKYEPNE